MKFKNGKDSLKWKKKKNGMVKEWRIIKCFKEENIEEEIEIESEEKRGRVKYRSEEKGWKGK